jgi:hypothetical protein
MIIGLVGIIYEQRQGKSMRQHDDGLSSSFVSKGSRNAFDHHRCNYEQFSKILQF